MIGASDLTFDQTGLGDDIGQQSSLDAAEVQGGVGGNPAVGDFRDGCGCGTDGADALLRSKARMRGFSVHLLSCGSQDGEHSGCGLSTCPCNVGTCDRHGQVHTRGRSRSQAVLPFGILHRQSRGS